MCIKLSFFPPKSLVPGGEVTWVYGFLSEPPHLPQDMRVELSLIYSDGHVEGQKQFRVKQTTDACKASAYSK